MTTGIGSAVGPYRITGVLGEGGMGQVFRATHQLLEREVALKVVRPEFAADPEFRARFIDECRLAATLNHPHVLPVYDAGQDGAVLYLATRLVSGGDLGSILRRDRRLSMERGLALARQVASALDAAHAAGLIHRDVKPANILIDRQHDADHAYLGDFGLTRPLGPSSPYSIAGRFLGTIRYAAPERLRGEAGGPASDQYSFAAVVFEALAGAAPFTGETETQVVAAHLDGSYSPFRSYRPELPPPVDAAFDRAFARTPDARFPSCSAFVAALADAALNQAVPQAGLTVATRAAPVASAVRRGRSVPVTGVTVLGIGAIVLVAAVFTLPLFQPAQSGNREPLASASPADVAAAASSTGPGATPAPPVTDPPPQSATPPEAAAPTPTPIVIYVTPPPLPTPVVVVVTPAPTPIVVYVTPAATPGRLEEEVRTFLVGYDAAYRDRDVDYLIRRLHPHVLETYDEAACRKSIREFATDDLTTVLRHVSVLDSWAFKPSGAVLRDIIEADVRRTQDGETISKYLHFQLLDGQIYWFGTCD